MKIDLLEIFKKNSSFKDNFNFEIYMFFQKR